MSLYTAKPGGQNVFLRGSMVSAEGESGLLDFGMETFSLGMDKSESLSIFPYVQCTEVCMASLTIGGKSYWFRNSINFSIVPNPAVVSL